MFLFNKNNALPRSRQSSIDSLVTDPSTSTSASTSDVWVSQSDVSSYGEMPSPEQRERTHPGKRSSVFNLRSRSNTATSTSSSFVSVPSDMTGTDDPSQRSSQDLRNLAGHGFLELSGGKRSLFARGKRTKRQSSQYFPGYNVNEIEETDSGNKRATVLRKGRRSNVSEGSIQHLKHRISSPFDFQHLTHTDRQQFAALEKTSENDLVAEFWAVRASQAPRRDLTGIKADDLLFQNFSSENLANPGSRSQSALGIRSPPLSPERAKEWQQPELSSQESAGRAIRLSRSVESFSQPGVKPRLHRHSQSANPPPRSSSSRLPLARIDDFPEESSDTQRHSPPARSRSNRSSGMWDKFVPLSPPTMGEKLPPITDEPGYFGHAVTTPDDSAIHTITPPFSPDLENVPEEPDRFHNPRPAPHPPIRSSKAPKSPSFDSFSFRTNQRSPRSRSNSRVSPFASPKNTQRSPMTRPISQMSDTLGSPTLSRRNSVRRAPAARRKSNTWRAIDESWEDDVDYIYENALEADCDYDWDHTSNDGAFEDRDRTPEQQDHERPSTAISQATQTASVASEDEPTIQTRFFPSAFRPSLLVPTATNVPDLESRSAVSASTADTSVQTPSDFFSIMGHRPSPFTEAEGFSLTPSLLIPQEYKDVSREEIYDDLLAEYEGSDRHFPLIDANQSVTSSSRSSHVRSSKRSSYDSSLMSSGQGSSSWSSPVRRSASSSGSLPELIHSRRARKNFDIMVDQLTDQVASFTSFGEDGNENMEDDDTTPPGRPSQDRTFFASDEEEHQSYGDRQESIESEVRASLELARQGSTRSTRPPPLHYHKYASSDGATKLLGSPLRKTPELQQPPKYRNRASSSSNAVRGNRQTYLSLFPAPPKHTPLPTPTLGATFNPTSPKF
ncbi:uncharacterized protein BDR25DRAFT_106650 [Lindgomyces ingoldianus]|uniref:Uncharacterized protein n=1 Tax=Lindgomyces ingoldianus TaxID=673940 RepID=A0ACB6QC46_9PLEO|nr:uncharacterized protein BDR25DRAFT_106650 [Lindgomyces ingoldianus]KAF2463715.1 hypothetical protein BDR25DRAFT_106650 [Lindgomyces ingoldianus]